MALDEQLEQFRAGWRQRVPPERQVAMQKHIDELGKSHVARSMLKVGDRAPAIVLNNAVGKTVDVAHLLAKGPVVVTFYRGGWSFLQPGAQGIPGDSAGLCRGRRVSRRNQSRTT